MISSLVPTRPCWRLPAEIWERSHTLRTDMPSPVPVIGPASGTHADAHGTILMGSQDGRVYIWDLTTKQLVAISPAQSDYVDTLAVSAAGWVVYASFGKALRLWNPQTGQQRSLPTALPTSNLILGPDGTSVIFGTAEGGIEYWDTRPGEYNAQPTHVNQVLDWRPSRLMGSWQCGRITVTKPPWFIFSPPSITWQPPLA